MADYKAAVPWVEDRFDQIMTARWLNRIVENTHALYAAAFSGGPAFRSVTMRAPYERDDPWDTPTVIWAGWYRHVNRYISGLYSIHRFDGNLAIDNSPLTRPGLFGHPTDALDPGNGLWYVEDTDEDTTVWFQIEADPVGNPDVWTDLITPATYGSNLADLIDEDFQTDVTGLGMTYGALYRVRVVAQNGAITIVKLWGEEAIASYSALPAVEDGFVLAPAQWNVFIEDQAYCKQLVDAPTPGFTGVTERAGHIADTTYTAQIWTGRLKHSAPILRYRIGARGNTCGNGPDDDQSAGPGMGQVKLVLAYGGNTYDLGASAFAVNDIYPAAGYAGTAEPTGFLTGAQVRLLSYRFPGGDYCNSIWRWVEGEVTLDDIVSIPIGDWYDVAAITSSTAGGTEQEEAFYGRVDFVGEVAGEGRDDLDSVQFAANDYVRGDAGAIQMQYVVDDMALTKDACEEVVQLLTPDLSEWPPYDLTNAPMLIRQRPLLLWAGGDADNPISIAYGSPTAFRTVELGYSSAGVVDLATVEGLTIGSLYWLTPRQYVQYAVEVYPL